MEKIKIIYDKEYVTNEMNRLKEEIEAKRNKERKFSLTMLGVGLACIGIGVGTQAFLYGGLFSEDFNLISVAFGVVGICVIAFGDRIYDYRCIGRYIREQNILKNFCSINDAFDTKNFLRADFLPKENDDKQPLDLYFEDEDKVVSKLHGKFPVVYKTDIDTPQLNVNEWKLYIPFPDGSSKQELK